VLHRAPQDDSVKVITATSYANRFIKEVDVWRFDERVVTRRVIGDPSRHLRDDTVNKAN
jgi:hypothetical protein